MSAAAGDLLAWYERYGRHDLPWRREPTPYRVLVSEFMLQQTQVDRVVPIFERFVTAFPSVSSLAGAPTADVVRAWRGLGYNTRAVRLQRVARAIVERYAGELPGERTALLALPGIGPYTASAIRAFAFNLDDVALDTNLRRIVHRVHFGLELPGRAEPRQIDAAARAMLARGKSFAWNSAMMDLGATICTARAPKCLLCPLRSRCAAAPIDTVQISRLQPARPAPRVVRFEETTRYARGRIVDLLRELPPGSAISLFDLHAALEAQLGARSAEDVAELVAALERDGIVSRNGGQVRLA
jgi:A/G-specific adenine glycosylase